MSYKIEWDKEILSISYICRKEGISEGAVYPRMKKTGEDPKTVILYYLNQPNKGNGEKIELNGIVASLWAHCKRLGISYKAITTRVRKTGETPKESLLYFLNKPNKGNREKIELNGEYLDVRNYCKQLNYDYNLVTRYKKSQPDKSYTEILKEWENLSQNDILNNIHLYNIWIGMLGRCENPKHLSYKWYGGKKPKPITVCKEWHDYLTFKNQVWNEYIEHVEQYGVYQTTLDRKKSWYNYSYTECEWKDWEGQGKNKSNTKYFLPCNNYQKTLLQHCKQNGYVYMTIINYIKKYNLTPDKAIAKYLKEIKNK